MKKKIINASIILGIVAAVMYGLHFYGQRALAFFIKMHGG